MNLRFLFFIVVLSGFAFLTTSCNVNKDPKPDVSGKFIKFFGTSGNSQASCLSETSDGFIMAGYSVQNFRSDKDILVIKTDKNGNRLWEKRFASKNDEYARHLMVMDNGQIWIAGTQFDTLGFSQALLLKLSAAGKFLDTLFLGNPKVSEDAYHVSEFPNGDFLVGGIRDTANERNMFVTRITAAGDLVWLNDIGVIGENDSLARIVMQGDGNLIWCGTSDRGTNTDIRIVKSTSNGGIIWSFEYGSLSKKEFGRDIIETQDGGFVVIGSEGENGNERMTLLKINSNGGSDAPIFPIEGNSGGYAISSVSTGGYIATGFRTIIRNEDKQLVLLRLDNNLGVQWSKEFGGSRFDEGHAILEASDGFFTIAGYTDLFQNNNNVFYLVKTDQNGEVNETKK